MKDEYDFSAAKTAHGWMKEARKLEVEIEELQSQNGLYEIRYEQMEKELEQEKNNHEVTQNLFMGQVADNALLREVVDAGEELEKEIYAFMEFSKLPDNIMSLCCNFTDALAKLEVKE